MSRVKKITESVLYIGTDDKTIDLFESQFQVPKGVSYNSYVIIDEKIAILDTVDRRKTEEWLENLTEALDGREPDYLIVSHMEPDHAANIKVLADKYKDLKIVGNAKTFSMISQFFELDLEGRKFLVKEGDSLSLGSHTLCFYLAPMVHWPEVMVTYEQSEKILFSADGFGKFGTLDIEDKWAPEARRYFINIVGKFGAQVQALLKKASGLDVQCICPLHGPVLKDNLEYYIGKYDIWSSYQPEEKGIVIAYASIHGYTRQAAEKFAEILRQKGEETVILRDLSRDDLSETMSLAFCYDRLVVAAATYDGGMFPCMEDFLVHLKNKNYQKRKAAIMENGSWAPMAGKHMKALLESMKEITVCEPLITIKSAMTKENVEEMEALAEQLV